MRNFRLLGKTATEYYAHRDSNRTPQQRLEHHVRSAHGGDDSIIPQANCPACKELQRKIDAK